MPLVLRLLGRIGLPDVGLIKVGLVINTPYGHIQPRLPPPGLCLYSFLSLLLLGLQAKYCADFFFLLSGMTFEYTIMSATESKLYTG